MLTLYFSGTGNTKYIAEKISENLNADCLSIEAADIDFRSAMSRHDCICVCYPIYASRVPYIFREFTKKYTESFKNKKIVILVTQYLFSGDGARAFIDLFPSDYFNVIYAEHFLMPNNISDFTFFPVKNGEKIEKMIRNANKKIDIVCRNITNSKIVKRGFTPFSRIIGLSQGLFAEKFMSKGKSSVKINTSCTKCGLCVKKCPMSNLALVGDKIEHNNNCTMCYRCVNLCPKQAVSVLIDKKPTEQYHGITNK